MNSNQTRSPYFVGQTSYLITTYGTLDLSRRESPLGLAADVLSTFAIASTVGLWMGLQLTQRDRRSAHLPRRLLASWSATGIGGTLQFHWSCGRRTYDPPVQAVAIMEAWAWPGITADRLGSVEVAWTACRVASPLPARPLSQGCWP